MTKTRIINIRLPSEVLNILDSLVDKRIYNSRSDAIREFTREFVHERKQ